MPEAAALPRAAVGRQVLRGAAILLLVAALFGLGNYSAQVLAAIEQQWAHLLAALGLAAYAAPQPGVSELVTKRSLVAVGTYSAVYTAVSLLLLWLALQHWGRFRLALQLYAGVFVAGAGLVVVGKLLGDAAWAYILARRLIDFIFSPLPVIILIPLLRWLGRD